MGHKKVEQTGFKAFKTVSRTINIHNKMILKYFDNKNINASAAPFYAKIKTFRCQFRVFGNINFFLLRLSKLFV
ncbi:transposase [Sphingobacterium sp. NPDC055431]